MVWMACGPPAVGRVRNLRFLLPTENYSAKLESIGRIITDLREVVSRGVAKAEQGRPDFVNVGGSLIHALLSSQRLHILVRVQRDEFGLEGLHDLFAGHLTDGFVHVDELRGESLGQKAFCDIASGV